MGDEGRQPIKASHSGPSVGTGVQEHDGRAKEPKSYGSRISDRAEHILVFSRALGEPNPDDFGYAVSRDLAGSSPHRPSYPCGRMRRLSYETNRTAGDLIFGDSRSALEAASVFTPTDIALRDTNAPYRVSYARIRKAVELGPLGPGG